MTNAILQWDNERFTLDPLIARPYWTIGRHMHNDLTLENRHGLLQLSRFHASIIHIQHSNSHPGGFYIGDHSCHQTGIVYPDGRRDVVKQFFPQHGTFRTDKELSCALSEELTHQGKNLADRLTYLIDHSVLELPYSCGPMGYQIRFVLQSQS